MTLFFCEVDVAYKDVAAKRANDNKWRRNNLTKRRKQNLEAYYRREKRKEITKKAKLDLLIEKAGRPPGATCELCDGPPGGRGRMHFDHDHETGAFRGWICHHCNLALGHAKDNIDVLRKMIDYLNKAVA